MRNSPSSSVVAAICLSLGGPGVAEAGGFSRGTGADTDLLFEEKNFNMRVDALVVVPTQKFSVNANPALVGTNFYGTYIVPSAAVKFNLTPDFRCVGTYTQNAGGDTEYAAPKFPTGKLSEEFTTDEFGAACAVRFHFGEKSVVSVIGGGFVEQLDYERVTDLSVPTGGLFPPGTDADLNLKGQEYGWRAGLAYEIPEYKLRTQIMYRSGTDYGATGTLVVPGALVGGAAPTVALPATGIGSLPQSLEFSVRTGLSKEEKLLAFGSVKWMDWSELQNLTILIPPLAPNIDQYQWRDGWTVTGGVGHEFTDAFSAAVSLMWDRGVSTGWDLRDDVWTLGFTGILTDRYNDCVRSELNDCLRSEFRGGVFFSYLAPASETQYANAVIPGNIRSGFNSATESGYAATFNVNYAIHW